MQFKSAELLVIKDKILDLDSYTDFDNTFADQKGMVLIKNAVIHFLSTELFAIES